MKRALANLNRRVTRNTVVFLAYAGFGIQVGRQNYMIPVDARIWSEADVRREGLSIESTLGEIQARGARAKLAVLDASRSNPFERRFRGFSAGLSNIEAPQGTLLLSAAAAGRLVRDVDGSHSLLIGQLLRQAGVPGVTAEEAFLRTRLAVLRASDGEQIPLISSSLVDDFVLAPPGPRGIVR